MTDIVQRRDELTESDYNETQIADQHRRCIDHWNTFLDALPEEKIALPSFPIWGDEFDATYPYEETTPWAQLLAATIDFVHSKNGKVSTREDFEALPSYARKEVGRVPQIGKCDSSVQTVIGLHRFEMIFHQSGSAAFERFPRPSESLSGTAKAKKGTYGSTSCSSGPLDYASRGTQTARR